MSLLSARASAMGLNAEVSSADGVADADLVICCTGSTEPLFDGSLVQDTAAAYEACSPEISDPALTWGGRS